MKKFLKISAYSCLSLITILLIAIFIKLSFFGKIFNKHTAEEFLLPSLNKKNIRLTFLGTSCFIIDYKGKQFVNDPYFSNQDFPSIIKGKTPLEKLSNYLPDSLYKNISLISITHGHFDHCMDIGTFLQKNTAVIADSSVFYQLHQLIPDNTKKHQLHYQPNDKWIYSSDSTFRVFTILSHHGPHFGHTVLFNGSLHQPLASPPHYLWDWQLGSGNYSYLVDVMEKDSIVFRMAFLAGDIHDDEYKKIDSIYTEKRCDIFSLVFWKRKLNESQIEVGEKHTKADIILFNHWNNFFSRQEKPLEEIRTSKILEMLRDKKGQQTPCYIMLPFTSAAL